MAHGWNLCEIWRYWIEKNLSNLEESKKWETAVSWCKQFHSKTTRLVWPKSPTKFTHHWLKVLKTIIATAYFCNISKSCFLAKQRILSLAITFPVSKKNLLIFTINNVETTHSWTCVSIWTCFGSCNQSSHVTFLYLLYLPLHVTTFIVLLLLRFSRAVQLHCILFLYIILVLTVRK